MGVVRAPSARSSQSIDTDHSGDEMDTHSFLRRGSSKRRRPGGGSGGNVNPDMGSVQSLDKRDFSHGLRPEHAGQPLLTRPQSETGYLPGCHTPSLPPTPGSPRSPVLNNRSPYESPSTSPGPFRRSLSPRREMMDVGFASAVANICEQAQEIVDQSRRKHKGFRHEDSASIPNSPQLRSRPRVKRPPLMAQPHVMGSPLPSPQPRLRSEMYRSTSLETRSRSPSPNQTPSSTPMNEYYGGSNLTDRSRSPSPVSSPIHTPPKRATRKLPKAPVQATKPSSLNLAQPKLKENMPRVMPSPTIPQPSKSPGSINFPRLNTSPTHKPKLNVAPVPQNIPPPGKLGRPEPYSPTERNNLNKVSGPRDIPGQTRSLPGHYSRRPNVPPSDHINHSSRQSPDLNKIRSHDSTRHASVRNIDESPHRQILSRSYDIIPVGGSPVAKGRVRKPRDSVHTNRDSHAPRSPRSNHGNGPNGFNNNNNKNGRLPSEKMELRGDHNDPVINNSDDDDDDDDWC